MVDELLLELDQQNNQRLDFYGFNPQTWKKYEYSNKL